MGRIRFGRVLDCFSFPLSPSSCLCMRFPQDQEFENKSLIQSHADQMMKLRDFEGPKTLACHLEPKTVILKVSMHCNGCARKVERHISKMEGVTAFEVDMESKKVVVTGDITPFDVLESISKVKFAELWFPP